MGIVEFVLDRARKEGYEEGRKLGYEPGISLGKEIARELNITLYTNYGIKKGQLKRDQEVVASLLTNTDFEIKKIAGLVNVSQAFVRNVKKSMSQVSLAE